MKAWIAVLLALVLCLSMTACGDSGVMSVLAEEKEEAKPEVEIPAAVLSLTEEDEKLLNGELKDGVYTNRYFGVKFTAPEGWSVSRLNDDAEETTEPFSLRKAYEEEMGGITFMANPESFDRYIVISIRALRDDESGLSEEDVVKRNNERILEINKLFGEDGGPELETSMFMGEEHPMSTQVSETVDGEMQYVSFYLPKEDFVCDISISTPNGTLEALTALFEKI